MCYNFRIIEHRGRTPRHVITSGPRLPYEPRDTHRPIATLAVHKDRIMTSKPTLSLIACFCALLLGSQTTALAQGAPDAPADDAPVPAETSSPAEDPAPRAPVASDDDAAPAPVEERDVTEPAPAAAVAPAPAKTPAVKADDVTEPASEPPGPTEAPDASASDVGGPYRAFSGGVTIADQWDHENPASRWRLKFGGYIRMQYRNIQDDPNILFYGRNDGFVLGNARPYLSGKMPNGLGFRVQLEATSALPADNELQPFRQMTMQPRDVFVSWQPLDFINVQVGQFKPPHNIEELLPTANLLFIDRSIGNQGVSNFEGRQIDGLVARREAGAQISGQMYFGANPGEKKGPGIAYALAVTNGSPALDSFNDNDALAYYGRLSLHWSDILSIGGAAYQNTETIVNLQDNVDQNVTGVTADAMVNVAGLSVLAGFQQRRSETQFLGDLNPADGGDITFTTARALFGQIGYKIPVANIQPAYRFSLFDPTYAFNEIDPQTAEVRAVDQLTYHTIGLNYVGETYPVTLMLNYTIAGEDETRAIDNNHFDAMMQLTW